MKPTPALLVRLRFSTKDVGKGFYRGNRTGSMGAHTPKGGYLIDYRKVRNYNVPDLTDFKLTPFVTREIGTREVPDEIYDREQEVREYIDDNVTAEDLEIGRKKRALQYLSEWRRLNPNEWSRYLEHHLEQLDATVSQHMSGQKEPHLERLEQAYKTRRDL